MENINFDFEYINQELEIRDLELDYKKIKFESEKIIAKLDDNLINIGGVFKNDLNLNLLSNIIDPNIKNFIDEQILLPTKSIFNITFNKKLKIGTVDNFQGQEAIISIFSLTSSTGEDAPRGLDFLLEPNRINVAISRAKILSIVLGSPSLAESFCKTNEEVKKLNRLIRLMN